MRRKTIRSSLVWAFSLVISIGILVLGCSSLVIVERALVDVTQKSNRQVIDQLNRILDGYIGYMNDLALLVWKNPDVDAIIHGSDDRAHRDKVVGFLAGIPQIRPDIDSLILRHGREVLTSSPGRALNPWLDPEQAQWFRDHRPQGDMILSAARVENAFGNRYPWVISLVSRDAGATLQVDLNYAVMEELCRQIQLGRSGYVFIVNGAGDIVFHPRQQLVYSGLKNEEIPQILAVGSGQLEASVDHRSLVYTIATSAKTGWSVVAVSYLDELFESVQGVIWLVLGVALLCLLVSTILASRVSLRISRPIEQLRLSMQSVETGNFDVSINVLADNEVADLAIDCDIAIHKVRDLMNQALVDQETRRRQDLLMLQSQINPHFLYNSLDSIIRLVEMGNASSAVRMTSTLAQFFRLGISSGPHLIPLTKEIEHAVSYLTIQKLRYGDKLEYVVDAPESVGQTPILKMLLQPLVENALYHGIKERDGPGTIRIGARRAEGGVHVTVADDGIGMAPELVNSLLDGPGDVLHELRDHIGLRNVHERIRLHFGARSGLSIASVPGRGTTVTIVLADAEGAP